MRTLLAIIAVDIAADADGPKLKFESCRLLVMCAGTIHSGSIAYASPGWRCTIKYATPDQTIVSAMHAPMEANERRTSRGNDRVKKRTIRPRPVSLDGEYTWACARAVSRLR